MFNVIVTTQNANKAVQINDENAKAAQDARLATRALAADAITVRCPACRALPGIACGHRARVLAAEAR